jgi:hypothetical protein
MILAAMTAGSAVFAGAADAPDATAWSRAHRQGSLSAGETRQFMRALAQFVFDNHLKKNPASPQRGLVYEYLDMPRRGQIDQFVEGEGLDTMHDGAWLAAALVTAFRATGDPFFKQFAVQWQLPFYLKMLNHSDTLFSSLHSDARPGAAAWGKEWAFQEGEKGFVPYYWDDGGSVSIDRLRDKNPLGICPCVDRLAGKPNPHCLLDGYSLGSSNHMAQDLGVMLETAWLLLQDSTDPAERKLAEETARAALNLYQCRVRHTGSIPMCAAPAALANGDKKIMGEVPAADPRRFWGPRGHYVRALYDDQPGKSTVTPSFADDQEYIYYYGIAKAGGRVPPALAFRTIYDAYTAPLLYRAYCDDQPAPPGVNRFDLYPYYFRDGKPVGYRSDRKGPFHRPQPVGSRYGPQNMVCCGWAIQMLRAQPGVWEEAFRREPRGDLRVYIDDPVPGGPPLATPKAVCALGGVTLELVSTRTELVLSGPLPAHRATWQIFSRPDATGSSAAVTLDPNGAATAVNDKQETLLLAMKVLPGPARQFTLRLPYTLVKGQPAWANAVEHGRLSIRRGDTVRNLYLASGEAQVLAALQRELGAGLRTWQAVFAQYGYIPSGIGTQSITGRPRLTFDDLSDSGGYAHLIAAGAEWLLCLEGKRDWELQGIPQSSLPSAVAVPSTK